MIEDIRRTNDEGRNQSEQGPVPPPSTGPVKKGVGTVEDIRRLNDEARTLSDEVRIDELQAQQDRCLADFLNFVDAFDDIAPEPVPHIHPGHEEAATRCRVTAVMAFLISWAIAYQLTGGAATHLAIAAWSLVGVGVADALFQLAYTTVPTPHFIGRFRLFCTPLVILVALSGTIVLLGRIASPVIADLLIDVVPIAWWALELGFLLLAALAGVGARRFGTTGRLTHTHDALGRDIATLRRRIQQRPCARTATRIARTAMFAFAVYTATAATATAQPVAVDRSGSIAKQAEAERVLVSAIANRATMLDGVDLLLLGQYPLSSTATRITWAVPANSHLIFAPLVDASRRRTILDIETKLGAALQVQVPKPRCTSLPAMISRVTMKRAPGLLLTDGKDDCRFAATEVSDGDSLFVLLTSAKGDSDDELTTYSVRRAEILRHYPRAVVAPLALVDDVVDAWVTANLRSGRRATIR